MAAPAFKFMVVLISGMVFCTIGTDTVANDAPAGMLTEAGTGNFAWLEEVRNTSTGLADIKLDCTVNETVSPSFAFTGRLTIVSVGLSLSTT